jgi:hypothetical protein
MSIDDFPAIKLPGGEKRKVYFDQVPEFWPELIERGYEPVLLFTMPRNDEFEERTYLKAKLQAVEEGTASANKEQLAALKTAIDLNFPKGVLTLTPTVHAGEGALEALDWGKSRFTLRGNTTMLPTTFTSPVGLAPAAKKEE